MTFFTLVRKSLVNTFLLCACIFFSLAEPHGNFTLKAASIVCSAIIQSNGSTALLEMVSNVSITTIHVSNGLVPSLSFSMCSTISLNIRIHNSNLSLNLNQNEICIQEIQLSASRTIFQNGTCILKDSVVIPESTTLELQHVTFVSPLNSSQIQLTVEGIFFFLIANIFYCARNFFC
jgi:hypothetical protein